MKIGITPKKFAQMFVRTRNGSEAAVRLGAEPSAAKLMEAEMLADSRVKKEIRRLDREDMQTLCYVKTGLSRLAFGSVNDAAALVFDEQPSYEKIMRADLFNVSEIKRVKGGGVEMKFFDRQKALEKLVELDPELKEISSAERFMRDLISGMGGESGSETAAAAGAVDTEGGESGNG